MVNQEDHNLSPPGKMAQNNNPYNAPSTAQMIEGLDPNASTEPKKFGTYGKIFNNFSSSSNFIHLKLRKVHIIFTLAFTVNRKIKNR